MANSAYRFEVPVPAGVKLGVRGEFSDLSGGVLWVRSVSAASPQDAQDKLQAFVDAVKTASLEAVRAADD